MAARHGWIFAWVCGTDGCFGTRCPHSFYRTKAWASEKRVYRNDVVCHRVFVVWICNRRMDDVCIFGGITMPSLQSIMTGQVPPNQQGELQGALTSLVSLTSIVGPLLMTGLFYYYSSPGVGVYFPGAPMIAGAILMIVSAFLARLSLKKNEVTSNP